MEPNTNNTPVPPTSVVEPTPTTNPTPTTPSHSVLAVVSMVLGILAFLNGVYFMGAVFGIAAIVLGVLSIKKGRGGKGFAKAGIILGAIGTVFGITFTVLFMTGVFGNILESYAPAPAPTTLSASEKRSKTLVDSKKTFSKGETARFGFVDILANSAVGGYTSSFLEDGEEYIKVNITITNKDSVSQSVQNALTLKYNGTVYKQSGTIDDAISPEQMQPGETLTGNLLFKVKTAEGTPKMKLQYTKEDVYDATTNKSLRLVWLLDL